MHRVGADYMNPTRVVVLALGNLNRIWKERELSEPWHFYPK